MIIYGEYHYQKESRDFIKNEILKIKPKIIVHELLFDYNIKKDDIQKHLDNSYIGGVCDPTLNQDIFEIALSTNSDLIGCDLSEKELLAIKDLPLSIQFQLREKKMLNTINNVLKQSKDICIVVGDIHLRSFSCPELGSPSCLAYLKNFVSYPKYNKKFK